MYNVKIIITNQNLVNNTTAEFFPRYAKFCNTFCNTFEFCNTFCNSDVTMIPKERKTQQT